MRVFIEVDQADIPSGSEFYNAKKRKRVGIMAVNPDQDHTVMLLPKEISEEDMIDMVDELTLASFDHVIPNDKILAAFKELLKEKR